VHAPAASLNVGHNLGGSFANAVGLMWSRPPAAPGNPLAAILPLPNGTHDRRMEATTGTLGPLPVGPETRPARRLGRAPGQAPVHPSGRVGPEPQLFRTHTPRRGGG